jgi:sulfatase modifying factor 1
MCDALKFVRIKSVLAILAAGHWLMPATVARADVFNMPSGQTSLQFVTVGDPGNVANTTGFGAVPYTYQMGTYDITAAQYCSMLNAVAKTDPYGLYNPSMNPGSGIASCGIVQSGSSGSYSYSVASSNANFPVNEVSWGDAARFCNWLANGQPNTGIENAATTEDGSYALNGAVTDGQLAAVTRSPSATYVIPTENEWYKAAYYKGGSTNAGYWLYPTQSNTPPSNTLSMTGQNNANFDSGGSFTDPATVLTAVGTFSGSPGPWGTFDQGGDVFQWTDTSVNGMQRVLLGGAFDQTYDYLQAGVEFSGGSAGSGDFIGFRIAEVPEPSSVVLLAIGAVALLQRRRRSHQ